MKERLTDSEKALFSVVMHSKNVSLVKAKFDQKPAALMCIVERRGRSVLIHPVGLLLTDDLRARCSLEDVESGAVVA